MSKSRFEKQSHVLWYCQYHLIWVPKYRFRVLSGAVKEEVESTIKLYVSKLGCRIIELNVQIDHVHLLVKVPPKVSISTLMGTVKGNAAIRVFTKFPGLKVKPCPLGMDLYFRYSDEFLKSGINLSPGSLKMNSLIQYNEFKSRSLNLHVDTDENDGIDYKLTFTVINTDSPKVISNAFRASSQESTKMSKYTNRQGYTRTLPMTNRAKIVEKLLAKQALSKKRSYTKQIDCPLSSLTNQSQALP